MPKTAAIVDYGMGNLRSVRNALEMLGAKVVVADDPMRLDADHVVLPGVGAFGDAMANLCARGWVPALERYAATGRPLLGICLGMQLLATKGTEFGERDGLGLVPGTVKLLERPGFRVPHIGWNDVRVVKRDGVLSSLPANFTAYFVHSYAFEPNDQAVVLGLTEYGGVEFASVVQNGNVMGTQFHPEKSQKYGLALLKAFLDS